LGLTSWLWYDECWGCDDVVGFTTDAGDDVHLLFRSSYLERMCYTKYINQALCYSTRTDGMHDRQCRRGSGTDFSLSHHVKLHPARKEECRTVLDPSLLASRTSSSLLRSDEPTKKDRPEIAKRSSTLVCSPILVISAWACKEGITVSVGPDSEIAYTTPLRPIPPLLPLHENPRTYCMRPPDNPVNSKTKRSRNSRTW
jgi:hypothetical protein